MKRKWFAAVSISLIMALILLVLPANVYAEEENTQTGIKQLNNVLENYIDEMDGREILDASRSSVSYDEKKPMQIYGYTYSEYEEVTNHVYSHRDLTYILGYPDGSVRGEKSLTRAEVSTIFYRLYEDDFPAFKRHMANSSFKDVSTKNWFYKEVETLYNAGIIDGYKDETFKPNDPITRAEFAKMIALWSNLNYVDRATFKDVPAGHWAYSYINAAAEAGWITGNKDGNYEPDRYITRAEAVSFVNGMVNRAITVEQLRKLGVKNPYNDLVESYWAYTDLIEASVKHSGAEWHGTKFNDGKFNIIVQHFVDDQGKQLAEDVTSDGQELLVSKEIERYQYVGYITEITYTYVDAKSETVPYIKKEVSQARANVGDKITYTVTMGNEKSAKYEIQNAVITDNIPEEMDFVDGSVQVNGQTHPYAFDDQTGILKVEVGNIKPETETVVIFSVTVNAKGYGKNVVNTAVMTGDNIPEKEGSDSGVDILDGIAVPAIQKEANKAKASVGDTITYNFKVNNDKTATVAIKNANILDVLPEEVDLNYGSVQINGKASTDYTYEAATRVLKINLGDIEVAEEVKVSFAVTINATAYGKTVYNLGTLEGDNTDEVQDKDDGVVVEDGTAIPSIVKKADRKTAKVGDTITYTMKVKNDAAASVNLKDAVMKDTIPEYLSFTHGSVLVDGFAWTNYSYDNTSKLLSVELGEIAPNQTKTVTITAVVNSTAYGKTFKNTAIISSSNAGDESSTDDGVAVDKGIADGSVGMKTVNKATAKVGDTLTYTIKISNGAQATAAWSGVTVTDVIPDHLSFNTGSVQLNGQATTNYGYDAGSKTLTLMPNDIPIGDTVTYTFTVNVEDGAQGLFIRNTAVLHSSDKGDIDLPDTGVQIEDGEIKPLVTKEASVQKAAPGDVFTYTVKVRNEANATAKWRNITMTDVVPTGLKLVAGSVTLNNQTVSYGIAGQAISVHVGDLIPGQEAVITFDVKVLDTAIGTTVTNVAVLKGDNGEETATDTGVTIEDLPGNTDPLLAGTKTVDKTLVNVGDNVTYTITAANNSPTVWTGVQIYDLLDTSMITFIHDTVMIDGVNYAAGNNKWTYADKQLVFYLGDINPGQTVTVSFGVQFKSDAANQTYINNAAIKGTDGRNVYVKAPEISIISGTPNLPISQIHYQLFAGFGDANGNPLYLWKPNDDIQQNHMMILAYRLMSDYYKNALGNGSVTVPGNITGTEVSFFISHGVISPSEYTGSSPATKDQIYRVLNFAGLNLGSGTGTSPMKRIDVAKLICSHTNRDDTPDTNGLTLNHFTDKGANASVIDEVSNHHDYSMDSYGNETWYTASWS